jgi:hypothetical protein
VWLQEEEPDDVTRKEDLLKVLRCCGGAVLVLWWGFKLGLPTIILVPNSGDSETIPHADVRSGEPSVLQPGIACSGTFKLPSW